MRGSKVMPLDEAVGSIVRPHDVVLSVYSEARPNAALMQLVRTFHGTQPELTLVTAGLVSVQHALVELGVVSKVIASFVGENYPSARPSPAFQRAFADGRVTVENWSMWSLLARLVAGALGVPFMPVRSLVGSGMASANEHAFAECGNPFEGSASVPVVAALRPDVAIVHAVAADSDGNLLMSAPYGEAQWGCLAAKRGVIATVEEVVDPSVIRAHSGLVRVPGHVVRSVSAVPFGSHPYGLFNPGVAGVDHYVDDSEFMRTVLDATRTQDEFREWIDEWILGVGSHEGYLTKLGSERLESLVAEANNPTVVPVSWEGPATPMERQIVAASRQIKRRVAASGVQAVLAGVGMSNLASWMAIDGMQRAGMHVQLMAEIGMYGYQPQPGDPFIFSHRNLPTSALLTDVMTTLGALVSGPGTRALGVLGAGEIDQHGNTGSTITSQGTFLVGSGGANDIASGADEILLTVDHRRLVRDIFYITSPGRVVRSVVSSRGVFDRVDDAWLLRSWIPAKDEDLDTAVEAMRAESPWEFRVADGATPEPEPSQPELALLRSYDPARVYLRTA